MIWPEHVKEQARLLRLDGFSYRMISERIGVPHKTIHRWLPAGEAPAFVRTCWCGKDYIARSAKSRSCCKAHQEKRYKIWGPVEYGQ